MNLPVIQSIQPPPPIVYVVDDEAAMVRALLRLLTAEGFFALGFTSAHAFREAYQAGRDGCVILDYSMPGLSGLSLQDDLARSGVLIPLIFLSGHADVPICARAMKAGAVDFLTKPVDREILVEAIGRALSRAAAEREMNEVARRLGRLTPREREVMGHVVAGKLNKQIAADLGTGEQNIKIHRGRVMKKLGVDSLAALVRVYERLGRKELEA